MYDCSQHTWNKSMCQLYRIIIHHIFQSDQIFFHYAFYMAFRENSESVTEWTIVVVAQSVFYTKLKSTVQNVLKFSLKEYWGVNCWIDLKIVVKCFPLERRLPKAFRIANKSTSKVQTLFQYIRWKEQNKTRKYGSIYQLFLPHL